MRRTIHRNLALLHHLLAKDPAARPADAAGARDLIELARAGTTISLSMDGSPLLSVVDGTFGVGGLGVGSFNDSAYFDDILVATPRGEQIPRAPP